jgi:hypothetical protein
MWKTCGKPVERDVENLNKYSKKVKCGKLYIYSIPQKRQIRDKRILLKGKKNVENLWKTCGKLILIIIRCYFKGCFEPTLKIDIKRTYLTRITQLKINRHNSNKTNLS